VGLVGAKEADFTRLGSFSWVGSGWGVGWEFFGRGTAKHTELLLQYHDTVTYYIHTAQ
jgi:hypothetical protein